MSAQPGNDELRTFAWWAPGLLGAALLLWGVAVDLLGFAIPVAVLVELPQMVGWRWRLARRDFDRVCDLTAVLLVMLALYQFDRAGVRGIYGMLAWAPLAFAPLVLAQSFSTDNRVSLASLFYSIRRAERRGQFDNVGAVDVRVHYFTLCLLSAATLGAPGNDAHAAQALARSLYLPGCIVLLALALYAHRPRRRRLLAWCLAVVLAGGGAMLGASGVVEARRALEPIVMRYMADYVRGWRDPFSGHASIGDVGQLKDSDTIVARVQPPRGQAPPRYLREASYQSFSRSMWMTRSRQFTAIPSEGDGERWTLYDEPGRPQTVRIAMALRRGRGLLPVPPGTVQLSNLPVEQVFRTELDILKVDRGPGIIEFDARSVRGMASTGGARPRLDDLVVPAHLETLAERYRGELGLAAESPDMSAKRLAQWFAANFKYSLDGFRSPRQALSAGSPVERFLEETRRGHCELFATATVVLLRSAGIPARYAVGYAVDEWSDLEQAYVVRRRHAHAWTEMWDGDTWRVVDTTPAVWFQADAGEASWWSGLHDWLSYAWHRFMRWRWLTDRGTWFDHLPWLIPPLLALLAWRLARRERTRRTNAKVTPTALAPELGADSEFFGVMEAVERIAEAPRLAFETPRGWLGRLRAVLPEDALAAALRLLPRHEQLRFDPRGLDGDGRRRFAADCANWLRRYRVRGGPRQRA